MSLKLYDYHHTAVICSDYEEAKHFYVDILGLQLVSEKYREKNNSTKMVLYLNRKYVIELFIYNYAHNKVNQPTTGYKHISFLTDDICGAEKYLTGQNVRHTEIRIDSDTGKKYFFLYDPSGNEIELYQL